MNSRQPSKEHTPVTSRNNSIIGSIPVIPKKVVEVVQLDVIESYGPSAKTASQTVTTTLFQTPKGQEEKKSLKSSLSPRYKRMPANPG